MSKNLLVCICKIKGACLAQGFELYWNYLFYFLDTVIPFIRIYYLKYQIIMKSLDPLRAKKTFIRKKLGHTSVSAIKASSVTL